MLNIFILEHELERWACQISNLVIVAKDESEARQIASSEESELDHPERWLNDAKCRIIGKANPDISTGVLLANFVGE